MDDQGPRTYLDRIMVDSLVHDPAMLRFLLDLLGPDAIALGSDYPFPLGERHPGTLIDTLPDLDDATRDRMRRESGLRFVGLPIMVRA